jgi:pimeloyl-ACP methyl ester carboxylesterase
VTPSTNGWLQRDGVDFHYAEWRGAGLAPPIVLLHGLGSNSRYWDRVSDHLRDRRLVALDLTHETPGRAAVGELLRDVAFAVEELELERPVVAGHSWGAALALEFVARTPALAAGLVFIDGPLMGMAPIFTWEEVEARMQPEMHRYSTVDDVVANMKSELREAWGEDLRPFVEAGLRQDGEWLRPRLTNEVRHQILRDLYVADAEELWRKVSVPATALIARKSDARISRSTDVGMQRLGEIAPWVEVKRLEGPHDIPLYAPAEVALEIERVARQAEAVSA